MTTRISKTGTALVDALADHFGVPAEHIVGDSRERRYCWPRMLAMYALYRRSFAQADIAKFFQKDHATVAHAVRNVLHRCNKDALAKAESGIAEDFLNKSMAEIARVGVAHGPKEQSEILIAIGELRNDIRSLRAELRKKK